MSKNQAESLVNSVRKSLTEHGDSLEASEKEAIEQAIGALEEAAKGDDKALIDDKSQALMTVSQKLGEKMYAAEQAAAPGGDTDSAKASAAADDNVVDAEIKEVKKDA